MLEESEVSRDGSHEVNAGFIRQRYTEVAAAERLRLIEDCELRFGQTHKDLCSVSQTG